MADLDTLAWYALGIPVVAGLLALEIVLARRRTERVFGFAETISNLTSGLGTLIIGLFPGPFVLAGWDFVRDHIAPWPWPEHGWWKFPAALVLADFLYYVYHRAGHRHALFWSIHGIHHQHVALNSSVGLRLEWFADPYAALFFSMMPLAGVDAATGFAAIAVLSLYTLTAHAVVLPRPTWGIFITPAIHGSHHSRDARYFGKNYGAMLGIWDRLFGTWLEPPPGDTLRTDVPSISRTHDGVAAQWSLIAELGRALRRTPAWREKLLLLYRPPALVDAPPLVEDDAIPMSTRVYVLMHFMALVVFSAWLLWFRDARPMAVQILSSVAIIGGLYTLGGLLDGRATALEQERTRLYATAVIGAAVAAVYAPLAGGLLAAVAVAGLARPWLRQGVAA
jgi:alkylglycerol monooxygenase